MKNEVPISLKTWNVHIPKKHKLPEITQEKIGNLNSTIQEKKIQTNMPHEYRWKNPYKILSNQRH